MFRFFRHIRQKLFLEGRVSRYLGYAIGEIILIVVGILISLYISDWNQARKDHEEETALLIRLKADFEQNQKKLKITQGDWREVSNAMRGLLEIMEPEPKIYPNELIDKYLGELNHLIDYQPNTGVINSLISSGKIALIKSEALNLDLNSWPTEVENFNHYFDIIAGLGYRYMSFYPKYHRFRDSKIANHTGPS